MAYVDCGTSCGWQLFRIRKCQAEKKCVCENCTPLLAYGSDGIVMHDACRQSCMGDKPMTLEEGKAALEKGQKKNDDITGNAKKQNTTIIGVFLFLIVGLGTILYFLKSK